MSKLKMSNGLLTENERANLGLILEDLQYLFSKEEITCDEIDDVLQNLKSDEVKSYIQNLRYGSKPETALREAFIAGKSILLKYLFGSAVPEVRSNGFVDYLIKDEMGRGIALELKPLFEAETESDKAGKPVLKKIKQKRIKPEDYRKQILKYIEEGEAQFVILTNLKEWFFYSKTLTPKDVKPFLPIAFFDFVKEYDVIGNLRDYLERKEFESIRYELDKRFLESLKTWVEKLSEVEFMVDERRKLELIISLINKFIFIQTLDDYGVIEFNWIRKRWNHHEQMWQKKGKLLVLERFFNELDDWFYQYYDTELFREKILPNIKQNVENIDKFYKNLQLVLGVTYLQMPSGALKGIMQYNFRYIDEDVFGKAYETFLADVRHDEGVYYTPKYITQYIAENTVGIIFDELLRQIENGLESGDFELVKKLVKKFISLKVLDPACGSGSFLIKTIRLISERYNRLNQIMDDLGKKLSRTSVNRISLEVNVKLEQIDEIREIIGPKTGRELISRILVRHIHGNDLDKMALEVAKVNIWLEAIKLAPREFRYDKLPAETNYILPALEMNLCNGDSVFGLPEEITINFLASNHRADIVKLYEYWQSYTNNPMQPELVDEIEKVKQRLRDELDNEFRKYMGAKQLSPALTESKPFHWALEFWHFFFDMNGNPLPGDERGADVVLGNPPYERIQVLKKKSPAYVNYLDKAGFCSTTGNYDLAVIFIEKGVKLLKKMGEFGYIVTNKFIQADYGEGIRKFLSKNQLVRELIDFGDQQVFEDATTYTMVIFLSTRPVETFKYALVRKLERNLEQLMKVKYGEKLDESSLIVLTQKKNMLSEKPWIFAKSDEEAILNKINVFDRLSNVARVFVGLQTSADPVYIMSLIEDEGSFVKVYSKARGRNYILEKDLLKPMLMGRDIKRWLVDSFQSIVLFPYEIKGGKAVLIPPHVFQTEYPRAWKYLLDNKEYLESRESGKWRGVANWYAYGRHQNLEQFDQPKIMTQVLASKASFALDLDGKLYFVGGGNAGGYGITLEPTKKLSLQYVCALMNSILLDWYLKKYSSRFRGGFYSYARRFLEKIPIKIPETATECILAKKCEQIVNRIIILKKAQCVLSEEWISWSTKLKTNEQSLEEILTQDVKNLRSGVGKPWISKVSFYPPECNEILNKIYNNFKVVGDEARFLIRVYGIDEYNNEEQIYELWFDDMNLMLHFYHSLLQALESRVKIKTLYQLFTKTMIPIIREVNKDSKELTLNIIKKVKEDFEKWKTENNVEDISPDIIKINNEIENAEAEIDALVFKLYGLSEDEIKIVSDSLKTPATYQAKVFEFFRTL